MSILLNMSILSTLSTFGFLTFLFQKVMSISIRWYLFFRRNIHISDSAAAFDPISGSSSAYMTIQFLKIKNVYKVPIKLVQIVKINEKKCVSRARSCSAAASGLTTWASLSSSRLSTFWEKNAKNSKVDNVDKIDILYEKKMIL